MASQYEQHFSMVSGDDKTLSITVTDSAGDAVDLTGASASWALGKQGQAALVIKTGTISAPATGVVTIALEPADTAALAGNYYHEMQVTDASGNVSTVAAGAVYIRADMVT